MKEKKNSLEYTEDVPRGRIETESWAETGLYSQRPTRAEGLASRGLWPGVIWLKVRDEEAKGEVWKLSVAQAWGSGPVT